MTDQIRSTHGGRRIARVIALSVCPCLLTATFVTMEIALAAKINLDLRSFTVGFRRFIFTTLFVPWFLGVLLGHWYHPFIARGLRGRKFLIHTLCVVAVTLFLILPLGLILFWKKVSVPYYVSTIMVYVGAVFGAWLWPVRVYSRI